jgi:hypothetical protein
VTKTTRLDSESFEAVAQSKTETFSEYVTMTMTRTKTRDRGATDKPVTSFFYPENPRTSINVTKATLEAVSQNVLAYLL